MSTFAKVTALLLAPMLWMPDTALACSVCMGAGGAVPGGDGNEAVGQAINGAIFVMLGFIGTVLAGVAAFALHLRRQSRQPLPPHEELARMISGLEHGKHHA